MAESTTVDIFNQRAVQNMMIMLL